MKAIALAIGFALASVASAQHVFRDEGSMSFSSYQINASRTFKLVCPPITTSPKGKYRWDGGSWYTMNGMDTGNPVNLAVKSKSIYPTGHGPSTSGQVKTINPQQYLVEFDWNENGTADTFVYVEFPTCEITVFYPGNGAVGALNFTVPPATVNVSAGAERYVTVNDPLPVLGDNDGDGNPDETDPDDDNDGIPDELDLFPNDPAENGDNDGDGTGDNGDSDDDNDGKPDASDPFPKNPGESEDKDGDGWGGNSDPDDNDPSKPGGDGGSDGDGTPDGGGTGLPAPGHGDGDRTGDDPRLNETSEGWSTKTNPGDGGKGSQLASKVGGAGAALGGKVGSLLPITGSIIPQVSSIPINISLSPGATINTTINLSQQPWPFIRLAILVIFTAMVAVAFLRKVTI